MSSRLPPEKITALKDLISQHLRSQNLNTQVKEVIVEFLRKEGNGFSEEEILDALQARGIIDEIIKTLPSEMTMTSTSLSPPVMPSGVKAVLASSVAAPSRRYLHLTVLSGKAFLEHLDYSDHSTLPQLVLHVLWGSQRLSSHPVACTCEPEFTHSFLLEAESLATTPSALLSFSDFVHLVLVRVEPSGVSQLVGTHHLEWRKVLENGSLSGTVEVSGVGAAARVPAGLLDIRLELLPQPPRGVDGTEIAAQLKLEKSRETELDRLFYSYAKQWWKEYLSLREDHKHRLVKIFALSEYGVNRPVCSFVRPLQSGRLLDSPRHAARFVSLIPYAKEVDVGGSTGEVWNSPHTFLTLRRGDAHDHALLLCSLLLGFGLNAFVCIGTDTKGPHVWVMTLDTSDSCNGEPSSVVFWESLTGLCYDVTPQTQTSVDLGGGGGGGAKHAYRTLSCVFNASAFYANKQVTDVVSSLRFDLSNDGLWKAMSEEALAKSLHVPAVPLRAPSIAVIDCGLEIENSLRALVSEYRSRPVGSSSSSSFPAESSSLWDDSLSYLLAPALASYELERLSGVSVGNEEFQQAIKRAVPEGHTFKGFPIQFNHMDVARMWSTLLKARVCVDLLQSVGDQLRLALRTRVFAYPENMVAVWVMVAVTYKELE